MSGSLSINTLQELASFLGAFKVIAIKLFCFLNYRFSQQDLLYCLSFSIWNKKCKIFFFLSLSLVFSFQAADSLWT